MKKIFILIAVFLTAFAVSPFVYALEQGEGYILIFFSDMGFDPPLAIIARSDGTFTSTGSFEISDLSDFTQVSLHIHYYTSSGFGAHVNYAIKVNGKTLYSNFMEFSSFKQWHWDNATVGSQLLKVGANTIEVTFTISGVTEGDYAEIMIGTDSFLYISNEQYSPPFLVTTDISEYLTQLRQEQISMKETLQTQQQQLTELSNKIDSITYLLITTLIIAIISILLNVYLYIKRHQ